MGAGNPISPSQEVGTATCTVQTGGGRQARHRRLTRRRSAFMQRDRHSAKSIGLAKAEAANRATSGWRH